MKITARTLHEELAETFSFGPRCSFRAPRDLEQLRIHSTLLAQLLLGTLAIGDVSHEPAAMNEDPISPVHARVDEHVSRRAILAAKINLDIAQGFATQPGEHAVEST